MLPLELDNMATMGPKASEPLGISAGGTSAFDNKKNWKELSLTSLVPSTPTANFWCFFSLNCAFSASHQSPSVGSRGNGPSRSRKPALPCSGKKALPEHHLRGMEGRLPWFPNTSPWIPAPLPGVPGSLGVAGREKRNDLWEETWLHFCSFGLSAGLVCYSNWKLIRFPNEWIMLLQKFSLEAGLDSWPGPQTGEDPGPLLSLPS